MDGICAVSEISGIIVPILEKYGASRAYLFGSYVHGDILSEGDVDLHIDGGRVRNMFGLSGLYNDLTEALRKPVGLVTTEALNHRTNAERIESFKKHTREDEKLIYEEESRRYFRAYPSLLY